MKKIITFLFVFSTIVANAQFTPGNLVLLRVGDGVSTWPPTTTVPVDLLEFGMDGVRVGTAIPVGGGLRPGAQDPFGLGQPQHPLSSLLRGSDGAGSGESFFVAP